MIVNNYGTLENSIDVTNLLVNGFRLFMENTGGDASYINGKKERHNKSIDSMVKGGLLESIQHKNKWCC